MSYSLVAKSAAAVCAIIYVLMLRLEIADLNADIEVYKSNEINLKTAVETAKETQEFTAGLLSASQEATNAHFIALQTANSNHFTAIAINAELQRDLDQAIRASPVVAASDVNNRTSSLFGDFWRQRTAYRSETNTDHTGTAIERPANDGSGAENASTGSN